MFGLESYGSFKSYLSIEATIFYYVVNVEVFNPKFKEQLSAAFDLADSILCREDYDNAVIAFEAMDGHYYCPQLTRLSMILRRKGRDYSAS